MKLSIEKHIQNKASTFIALSDSVWETPELGFQEEESSRKIIQVLKEEGFAVEAGLAGIPTAFKGIWGKGEPRIGFLGEFDALPNLSQKAGTPQQQEQVCGGNGHGCGHNALGAGSLAAAVALKDYLTETKQQGTVEFYGCPGEEFGCGKAFMAREKCFDQLDCAFSWHPMSYTSTWDFGSLAHLSVLFDFKGISAHAAAAPHAGRSALDAAELMNVGVNFLREHVIPEARIHYAFHDTGGPAPNVVHDRARLHYYIRAPKIKQVKEILERVKKVAAGAAMMTETQVTTTIKDGLSDYIPNHTLTNLLNEAMHEIGPIPFDKEDYALAQQFHTAIGEEAYQSNLTLMNVLAGTPQSNHFAGKTLMDEILVPNNFSFIFPGSTDVGDVSYVTPTAQLLASCAAMGTAIHTWQMTAQTKTSLTHKGMLFAAKSMALAAAKAIENPQLLKKAKEDHAQETEGHYVCPFPDEIMPTL